MKPQYTPSPHTGQHYRIELARTSLSPTWWEYQVIDNATGALVAGGEIRGARHLVQVAADREVRKLEAARQPFYIPPIQSSFRVPC